MKQKQVYIMSAPPGAGKTTWVKEHLKDYDCHISRDEIRFSLLSKKDGYFKHENEVFKLFIDTANKALENPTVDRVFIDATHITKASRAKVISKLNLTLVSELNCFCLFVPLETCLAHNELRSGRAYVPPSVIQKMFAQYEEPTLEEGFDHIYKINEKGEVE